MTTVEEVIQFETKRRIQFIETNPTIFTLPLNVQVLDRLFEDIGREKWLILNSVDDANVIFERHDADCAIFHNVCMRFGVEEEMYERLVR
jgi:hypothetical protein